MAPKQAMTREEADTLIAEASSLSEAKGPTGDHMIEPFKMMANHAKNHDDQEWRDLGEIMDCAMHCIENETLRKLMAEDMIAKLLPLARLGASVAAPRDDEIEAMAASLFQQEHRHSDWYAQDEHSKRVARARTRIALSALRESKP